MNSMSALFDSIRKEFPQLHAERDIEDPELEHHMLFPVQVGLDFEVNIYLYGDELHLCAGLNLALSWFPCTDPRRVRPFREAVTGVLSGRYRVVEYHRGDRPVSAELQKPSEDGWKRVGTWARLHVPWPLWRTTTVLQNLSAPRRSD